MYLNDDLVRQICEYETVSDKYNYVLDILDYYSTTNYTSDKKTRCIQYWIYTRQGLDLLIKTNQTWT